MAAESDEDFFEATRSFKVLSPGMVISHYKIVEKIGEGGMGVVYKAEDTKLKRHVALKFLPPRLTQEPEAKERFVREAQATSALDHPNICMIHEIDETQDGKTFIAMACYEGKTLKEKMQRGYLKVKDAVDIAVQVAQGLAKAHKTGIIHRDIKPANVMLTTDGRIKIMDFGLAKLAGQARLTEIGAAVGTVVYMSPEQARGDDVDQRADVWSLGVVLYEMLTGRLPFRGDSDQAVIYSILNEEPEPVRALRADVPFGLELIVDKALMKSLDERYREAGDMLAPLTKVQKDLTSEAQGPHAVAGRSHPSIAVLPFANLSADPEQEYFCEGLAEEIINALTHVDGLRVVARTSSFAFKDKREDIRKIGNRLSVETLLEGSVRKAGSRLRITAQLVNVADGYHLWAEKYDRDLEDIFGIQDDVSLAIVENLKVKLLGGEREKLVKRHTLNPEAHGLYLKGRYFWNQRTEASLKKSIACFSEAIQKDPTYAKAFAGLADSYLVLTDSYYLSPKEAYPKAKEAASRALEIDSTLSEAHTSLAFVLIKHDFDWAGAERGFKRALDLNPGYATAHHWYAFLLLWLRRFDEAISEIKVALDLDPLSLIINRDVGQIYFFAGQYDQAMEALEKVMEIEPNFSGVHVLSGSSYLAKSMYEQALEEFKKEQELASSLRQPTAAWMTLAYARMGKVEQAREILEYWLEEAKHTYVSSLMVALMWAAIGIRDQALEWIWRACEERDSNLSYLMVIPGLEFLKSDPRFTDLLVKMGLAE